MRIRYVTKPGYGSFGWPRPHELKAQQTKYAGVLDVPFARCFTSKLTTLHEMAHALVYTHIGITDEYLDAHRLALETEASAIAIAWVKPSQRGIATRIAASWLLQYTQGQRGMAHLLLANARAKVTAAWRRKERRDNA